MAAAIRVITSVRPREASSALKRLGVEAGRVVRFMGGNVDESGLQPLGIAVAEFERGKFLEVIMQQPGVVERRQ